jgi:hypothetical protein
MPGYYQPVPPGQKPFSHRSASELSWTLMGLTPWAESSSLRVLFVCFIFRALLDKTSRAFPVRT